MTKRILVLLLVLVICTGNSFSAAAAESVIHVTGAPTGIVVTPEGDLLVTDTYHKVIWKITGNTSVVYAGGESVRDLHGEPVGGYYDGPLNQSLFLRPWAIVPFLDGYAVSDAGNNVIRLIGSSGTKTAAGSAGRGSADGNGGSASFDNPTGLAVDEYGNLYVADTNNGCIRKMTTGGVVKTYVSGLNEPTGLFYHNQILYVAESGNHRILMIKDGNITVAAGGSGEGFLDGAADEALFSNPQGVAVSDDGVVYISDTGNSAVRKIQDGTVTTILYHPPSEMAGYPVSPMGLVIRGDELLICDNYSRKIITIKR